MVLQKRVAAVPRAPLATRGFYGQFSWRGRDELKVIDNPAISGGGSASGTLVLLNGVAQGTDYTQRIGRKILLKSLLFRFSVFPSATASSGEITRLMIIYDCQTNAATPVVTDVLNSAIYNSPMNLNNRDRFKILVDKFFTTGAVTYTTGVVSAGMAVPRQYKVFKKMSMEEIFGGTGNTVGSINTGGIFALIITQDNSKIVYVADSRIRFIDS